MTSAESDIDIARARDGGVWSQDSNTVIFDSTDFIIRQSYGAWAFDPTTTDFIFIAPRGGGGDRHYEYDGTGTIIYTGVA